MNNIARFFTIYWCIYFPTCIAYNELAGFSSIDEVMTGIIVLYTYAMKRIYSTNKKPWKEFYFFLGLLVFYIVYSLLFGVNVPESVAYDLMQQVRPWSVIYCTWILNPQFTEKQKQWMRGTMLLTVITFIFYHPELGTGDEFRSAPFGQLAICTSMAWYLFSDKSKKNMIIAAIIAVIGLLGMKFKYYGQFGAWMFILFYIKKHLDFKSMKFVWQMAILVYVVVLLGWDRFNTYYVEGMTNEELARPMINKATWEILWDYFPFGCGFGGFGTAAAAVYYSPLWKVYHLNTIWGLHYGGSVGFHCDSFFGWFAEIGFFGVFFFVIFWKRRLNEINKIVDDRYYKVAIMSFFCICIEWTGDQSFFSGKGMGYLMLLGLCLNANYNQNIIYEDEEDADTDDSAHKKKRRKGLIHLGFNFKPKTPKRIAVK